MSTATPPPASTPAPKPAVTKTEEYFNSSRLKVIGLITAATVAVGALGGIAGVVFDPDPIKNEPTLDPGGSGAVGSAGATRLTRFPAWRFSSRTSRLAALGRIFSRKSATGTSSTLCAEQYSNSRRQN